MEPTPAHDRRQSPRFTNNLEGVWAVVAAANDVLFSGQVLSLSRSGVGLVISERIEKGATALVRLINASHSLSYERGARVVHARAASSNEWVVGCEFTSLLGVEELESLKGRLPSAFERERSHYLAGRYAAGICRMFWITFFDSNGLARNCSDSPPAPARTRCNRPLAGDSPTLASWRHEPRSATLAQDVLLRALHGACSLDRI